MNHVWNRDEQKCTRCDINYSDYVNDMEWGFLFCHPDPNMSDPKTDDCCLMPSIVNIGGIWSCETCSSKNTKLNVPVKITEKKCTCGYAAIGVNNLHSDWCDAK